MPRRPRLPPGHPPCAEFRTEYSYPMRGIVTAVPHTTRPDARTLFEEEHRAVEKLFDPFKRPAVDDLEREAIVVQRMRSAQHSCHRELIREI
jgi:hypothetical protein